MVRCLSALLTRPSPFTVSVVLHVSAVMAGGHALSESVDDRALAGAPMEIEIELADTRVPVTSAAMPAEQAPPVNAVRPANAGHRHSYRLPPDHDARAHDPSVVHLLGSQPAAAQAAPVVAETSVEPPLHFVLASAGGLSTRAGATGSAQRSSGTAFDATGSAEPESIAPAGGSESDATFPESAVDAKARLSASAPVVYPEAARAAELEADVRLDLVVDAEGRVVSARPLALHGLGLDDAALRAVRAYRFSPARRRGRPVGVRMEWTVAFRLQ